MKKILKNTAILTVITLVAGTLLGLVYEITKKPIEVAHENAKQEAYKKVLEDAFSFETYKEFDAEQANAILKDMGLLENEISEVAVAKDKDGNQIGCVITAVSHEGYGGDIVVSVGIQNDGTVKGIEMLKIGETAGLGMKATEPEFKDQFKDKQVPFFKYTKSGESGDEMIDALGGATITTNAVTNAINAALVFFQDMTGGAVNE